MVRMYPSGLAVVLFLAVSLSLAPHPAFSADDSSGASAVELAMWEYAVSTGKVEEVDRFLQLYPNSVFTEAALELKETLSSNNGNSEPKPEQQADTAVADTSTTITPVSYDEPLANDNTEGGPRSIKQLASGSPLFPPIADLPAEYWESKTCSDCHAWNRDNLCEQASFLANREAEAVQRIRHPYGGFFKDALRAWAAGGCL